MASDGETYDLSSKRPEAEQRYWRWRLHEAGYTIQQAEFLVAAPGLDLHAVEALVLDRGCAPAVAFDIFS